jgi:hypothetical protein
VQQGRRLIDVSFVGGGADHRVYQPRGDIHSDMRPPDLIRGCH